MAEGVEVGRARIPVEPDTDGFGDALEKDVEKRKGFLGGIGGKAGKAIGVGLVGAFGAAAGGAVLAKSFVDSASDLSESLSKVGVVFGENAGDIESWSKRSATAFGQSQAQALEAAGTYGNLFQAFGVGRDEASEMSTSLVELAADLASFNNTSVDDALGALQSGLSGETEPLKRFGVAINDARLKDEALRLGLIKTTKEALSPGAKAQASYALIMKDTALAQGDFARTSDGLANKQRIMGARFDDLKATLGKGLIPIFSKAIDFALELTGGVTAFLAAFKAGDGDITSSGLAGFLERVGYFARQVSDAFREDGLGGAISLLATRLRDAWPAIQATLMDLGARFLEQLGVWGEMFVAWIGPRIGPFLAELGKLVQAAAEWLLDPGLPTLLAKLREWGDAFVAWIGPNIVPMLIELGKLLGAILYWAATEAIPKLLGIAVQIASALLSWTLTLGVDIIAGIGKALGQVLANAGTWVADMAKVGADMALGLIGDFLIWYLTLPAELALKGADVLSGMLDLGKDLGKGLINGVIDMWNQLGDWLRIDFEWDPPGPGSINFHSPRIMPYITPLATGGVVTEPTLAMLAEVPSAQPEIVTPERLMRDIVNDAIARGGSADRKLAENITFVGVDRPQSVIDELSWLERTGGRV